jgi:hypothetical protein
MFAERTDGSFVSASRSNLNRRIEYGVCNLAMFYQNFFNFCTIIKTNIGRWKIILAYSR